MSEIQEPPSDAKPDALTDEEKKEAFAGSAPHINKMVCIVGSVVRLAFLECDHLGIPHHRAAVSMNLSDAIELRKLLERMLGDIEREIAKATVPTTGPQNG